MDRTKLQNCIDQCWTCRHECQKTLYNYCLQEGGQHVEQEHVKLMTDCIQICQIAADFMVRNSKYHMNICETCAKICEACAKSCAQMTEPEMQKCSQVCFECATTCKEMM